MSDEYRSFHFGAEMLPDSQREMDHQKATFYDMAFHQGYGRAVVELADRFAALNTVELEPAIVELRALGDSNLTISDNCAASLRAAGWETDAAPTA